MYPLAMLLLLVCHFPAKGEDLSHFRRADIPRNESRLSALAGVREFRCNYDLARFSQGTLLIAEVYKDGKRTHVYRLSRAKYDGSGKNKEGIISIGWRGDSHTLVSVHDNGDLYSPWTAFVLLPDFVPFDAFYFADSSPEKRGPERKGGMSFELYPVLGICGQRNAKIAYQSVHDQASFLAACRRSGAKEAVVFSLYLSDRDEDPSVKFD